MGLGFLTQSHMITFTQVDHVNRRNTAQFPLQHLIKNKAWKKGNFEKMNNRSMRKNHQIKQPGYDVQRRMR